MNEQLENKTIEEAASALIETAEQTQNEDTMYALNGKKDEKNETEKKGLFQSYKIKDIVFLAIITACTLITGAIMPLLVNVPLFGIVQLGLGLQFSIFPVIGMISRKRLILLSIFMLFSDVVVNAFVVYNVENSASIVLNVFSIYNIMTCVFALSVQFLMLSNEHYESELKIVESLWRKDKQTYEMTKESMEIINTKCHDLRKRIRIARKRSRIDEQELAEIEHAINIYEDNIKTGNETLDVILSEASFICRNNHITFIAIADGARLDFMSSGDIYSVIQNAINNATNAVMSVKESDRRIIRVMVRENVGKTEIHVENYFNNVSGLQFEDGLPVTKKDKRYHGFGMRSIKNICKKYNGTMNVEIEDDIFNLNIVFPL